MIANSLEKVLDVKDFFDQYTLSQQKQSHIKKLIVQAFHQLQKDNPIKNQFKLITKSELIKEIDKLRL